MRVWIEHHHSETTKRVIAEFTLDELTRVELDQVDLGVLREPIRSGADILADAELIARRLEQQSSPEGTDS